MNKVIFECSPALSIQQLMSSYCRHVDSKDWKGLKSILRKNITFTFQDESGRLLNSFKSRKSFLTACLNGIGEATTVHHLHNPEFKIISKNVVEGVWAMEDRFYIPSNAAKPILHGYGHYHVRFYRENSSWQIGDLLLTRIRLHMGNNENIISEE